MHNKKEIEYKGFKARIMKAPRLTGEGVHGLPPGNPIDLFAVDEFKSPLPNWIKGPGNFVVPVQSDWGLWFDWRGNDELNTAVLPTVKGMNPITGRRTNGFALERYEEKCPNHDILLKSGRYCEKCGFKLAPQNYIASPNTLWWDGFRTNDGKVRQFFFTEDLAKSIPEQVIGKEDTVPAFGFAFYEPKQRREPPPQKTYRGGGSSLGLLYKSKLAMYGSSGVLECSSSGNAYSGDAMFCTNSSSGGPATFGSSLLCESKGSTGIGTPSPSKSLEIKSGAIRGMSIEASKPLAEVGVGAGAEIGQDLVADPLKLEDWKNEPSSVMRLYFIFVEQFKELYAKGMNDLSGSKEGYLTGLPVG